MRRLAFGVLLAALACGFVGAVLYLWNSAGLPDLSSKEAITAGLATVVESQRQVVRTAKGPEVRKFEAPPLSAIPTALTSLVLASESCPEALAAPKEGVLALGRRMAAHTFVGRGGAAGPGRCHLRFALQIAQAFGVADRLQTAIAAPKVLGALSTEDLFALRIASTFFAPGVVGYSQASLALFKRELSSLDLAQTAELVVAEARYPEISTCTNPLQLRRLRDDLLNRATAFGLLQKKDIAAAKLRPLSCSLEP